MRRVRAPVVKPQTKPILPGRVEPTWHTAQWPIEGETDKWLYPSKRASAAGSLPGHIICPVCHAISDGRHWLMDEERYQELRRSPDVKIALCPADQRILKQMYDGEVVLRGTWMGQHRDEIINWVHNEEKRARESNPMARLASVQERDGQIYILTTSQALARRIGSGLKSAFKGRLRIQKLPYETFTRVRWARD